MEDVTKQMEKVDLGPKEERDKRPAEKYYAVAKGRELGVFTSWAIVEPLVTRCPGNLHQSFESRQKAEDFIVGYEEDSATDHLSVLYVLIEGRQPGIYTNWLNMKPNVIGLEQFRYNRFLTEEEAEQYFNGDWKYVEEEPKPKPKKRTTTSKKTSGKKEIKQEE